MAETAGAIALAARAHSVLDGPALGRIGDQVTNTFLMEALAVHRPEDAVLCEECADTPARIGAERVWIIDPLDGTREYGERRDDWSVHVALTIGGRPGPAALAVPARGLVLRTDRPPAKTPARSARPRLVVSRTRRPPEAERIAAALGAEILPLGSAGAKAAAVLLGEAEIYVHSGGQREWDNCAPVCLALAAGLHAARLDGTPLRYNQADVLTPDLIICRPELVPAISAALA